MILKIKERFGPLIFLLLGMLVVSFSNPTPLSAAGQDKHKVNCDLHRGLCTKKLSGYTVTLEVNPKPVRAMTDLVFSVTLSGNLPADLPPPYIDIGMPGMNMGPNRVILKSAGTGVYEGRGIIVRCPSGKQIWRAAIIIPESGRAEFIFHVIY
jgi:hypothetical protein